MLQSSAGSNNEVTFVMKIQADNGYQAVIDRLKRDAREIQGMYSGVGIGGGAASPVGAGPNGASTSEAAVRAARQRESAAMRERANLIKQSAQEQIQAERAVRQEIERTDTVRRVSTMRAVEGAKQIANGITQAARAFALLGVAGEESMEKAIRKLAQFEAGVHFVTGALNVGQGAARMLGGLARVHPGLAVGAVGLAAAGGIAAYNSGARSRWDVWEEEAEMERRRSGQRTLAASDANWQASFPGQMALSSAERAPWRRRSGYFAQAQSSIDAMRAGAWTESNAALERLTGAATYNANLRSHQTAIGEEQMGILRGDYAQAQLRGASVSTEADRMTLRLKHEQLETLKEQEAAARRFADIQNEGDRRHLSMLREHSASIQSELAAARRANDDAQVVFGNMRPAERARITDIARRAQAGELISRRDRMEAAGFPGLQSYLDESARREARNVPGFLNGPVHSLNGDRITELQPKAQSAQFIASQFADIAATASAARERQLAAFFEPKFEEMEANIAKAVAAVMKSDRFEERLKLELKAKGEATVRNAAGG